MNNPKKECSSNYIRPIIVYIILILLILALLFSGFLVAKIYNDKTLYQAQVTKVIDGDTFEISTGEKVRLICVDSPEYNEVNYTEAKDFLASLIQNKTVIMKKDISETDNYGRLLRYVYLSSGEFVNKEIVKRGYAILFPYKNDTSLCDEIAANKIK